MSRRSKFWSPLCAAGCMAFSVASANSYAAEKDATGFIPDITVIEIMESIVMPTAQKIWDAVGVDVTAQGQIEKKPQNDEEWAELRAAAVTLAEATNALVVPGRHAAPAGTKSLNPDSELEPAQIEALLAKERPAWVAHAAVLHATAMQAIKAIDDRNIDAISEVGGSIDEACESCHLQFWYPNQK
jgi:cytochrome c556